MDGEELAIYNEGYYAWQQDKKEEDNPYSGMDAEFWSDGWQDAEDDANGN
ncbi:hypothetical protein VSVS12_04105 [Vibrio scophthalmi]|nr:hypothetical protein [Vibrio scophthalmi]ANS87805.1 hypothetical protein VSVS12_04105 [Vibrio scophthalmi]